MELKNKKGGDDSKLWIIGDSFTGMGAYHNSWQYLLYEKCTSSSLLTNIKNFGGFERANSGGLLTKGARFFLMYPFR